MSDLNFNYEENDREWALGVAQGYKKNPIYQMEKKFKEKRLFFYYREFTIYTSLSS